MSSPPLILDKLLDGAVKSAVGEDAVTALVVGSKRLAASLARAGHAVTLWQKGDGGNQGYGPLFDAGTAELERYDVLVLVQVLGRRPEPFEDLRHLVRAARPGGLVILIEQAAWGRGGRWLGRLVGRLLGRPLFSDASELGALCLNAGLTQLRQTWPQGLRSLVLTRGRVHALARLLD